MTRRKGVGTLIKVSLPFQGSDVKIPTVLLQSGFCKRGEKCWFLHKSGGKRETQVEEEDEFCSICFEKPSTYGLLGEYWAFNSFTSLLMIVTRRMQPCLLRCRPFLCLYSIRCSLTEFIVH